MWNFRRFQSIERTFLFARIVIPAPTTRRPWASAVACGPSCSCWVVLWLCHDRISLCFTIVFDCLLCATRLRKDSDKRALLFLLLFCAHWRQSELLIRWDKDSFSYRLYHNMNTFYLALLLSRDSRSCWLRFFWTSSHWLFVPGVPQFPFCILLSLSSGLIVIVFSFSFLLGRNCRWSNEKILCSLSWYKVFALKEIHKKRG